MNRRRFLAFTTPATLALIGATRTAQQQPQSCAALLWSRLLVADGNSISANWPARDGAWPEHLTWPNQIMREPWFVDNGFGLVNMAIKGCNILDMSERAPMGVDKLARGADEAYIVVWELTNTMYYWTVSETFHFHANYCKARKAAGYRVLIGTGISRDNAHFNIPNGYTWADMQELNNMIRTYWFDFADGLLDFAGIPELGGEFSWQDAAMFVDGVHLTDAGSALAKAVVLAELQRQVASSATATPGPTVTATQTPQPTETATSTPTATPQPMDTIVATIAPRDTATAQPNVQSVAIGQPYFMPIVER